MLNKFNIDTTLNQTFLDGLAGLSNTHSYLPALGRPYASQILAHTPFLPTQLLQSQLVPSWHLSWHWLVAWPFLIVDQNLFVDNCGRRPESTEMVASLWLICLISTTLVLCVLIVGCHGLLVDYLQDAPGHLLVLTR